MEMTLTRADLLRLLPAAVGGGFEQDGDEFRHGDGARGWRLRVADAPGARLGPVTLHRLALDFEFRGFTAPEREAFLARFRLHFHKGGG
jgi:hypothetical protein